MGSSNSNKPRTRPARKKKPARPKSMDRALEQFLRSLYPKVKSTRGLQEKQHQTRAVLLVMDQPEFRWLFDPATGTCRSTILTELGRIEDDGLLLEMAAEICRRRPKTREAVAAIRRVRGARSEPSSRQLAVKLVKSIDAYLKRYPATTWQQVRVALFQTSKIVEDAMRDPGE